MLRDPAWLLDMLMGCRQVREYAKGMSELDLMASRRDQDAILHQLMIVGEAAKQVSPAFRDVHPEIPWSKIGRFRDLVVHHYFGVDMAEVSQLEPLVPPEDPPSDGGL
jgi:uncharacterized protein with HEPN domain